MSAPLKPKLAVGDRVRVYEYGDKFKGIVHSIGNTYVTVTSDKDGACRPYYPEQIRRLKRKPKPEGERLERWIRGKERAGYDPVENGDRVWEPAWACIEKAKDEFGISNVVRLVEVRKGERVLSRKELERAWDSIGPAQLAYESPWFTRLCTALGFKESK